MLRSIFLWFIFLCYTVFWGTIAIIMSVLLRKKDAIDKYARIWAKWIIKLIGTKTEIIGLENILLDQPQIFMCNHQSGIDILLSYIILPIRFVWRAKKELFRIPLLGWSMSIAGYIPIDRSNARQSLKSLKIAAERIKNGTSVVIFQEGTRSIDGKMLPFKNGGFKLALEARCHIVPFSISGANNIVTKNSYTISPGSVKVIIHKPIDTTLYNRDSIEELKNEVRKILEASI